MKSAQPGKVWQIRAEIQGTRPQVWRRVLVSDRITLLDLHSILQDCFGWQDYHLHEFTIRGKRYSDPDNDEYGEMNLQDDAQTRLRDLGLEPGERFRYVYDFGDGWQHFLCLEEILPAEKQPRLPSCIGGARACPPEDVGGVGGYAQFLQALADPDHPEHTEYSQWIGGAFDPDAFNLQETNERLRQAISRRRAPQWNVTEQGRGNTAIEVSDLYLKPALELAKHETAAHSLPLRRDVLTLLGYLREHKVTGTQSTGNLPLKAVSEVSAAFVDPPVLQQDIGGLVYRIRSEEEVPSVYFAHLLARGAELLDGGPARRWRLTPRAESFFAASAVEQVLYLFRAWWIRVDWLLAVPFDFFGGELPPGFQEILLSLLRAIPVGQSVEFEPFIERLIAKARWTWPETAMGDVRGRLAFAVELTAIGPLEQFGVLSLRRVKEANAIRGVDGWSKLAAFSLTDFGRMLLEVLR
jgi:hypothetical protein